MGAASIAAWKSGASISGRIDRASSYAMTCSGSCRVGLGRVPIPTSFCVAGSRPFREADGAVPESFGGRRRSGGMDNSGLE